MRSSPSMTAATSVKVPPVSTPITMGAARRFPMGLESPTPSGRFQQDLELGGLGGPGERGEPFLQRIDPGNERAGVDRSGAQRVKRGAEPAASRARDFNLLDDDRRQVDARGVGHRGLENQLPARADQFERARKSAGRAGAFDDHVKARPQTILGLSRDTHFGQPLNLVLVMAA